jgi:hypothetical protein
MIPPSLNLKRRPSNNIQVPKGKVQESSQNEQKHDGVLSNFKITICHASKNLKTHVTNNKNI